MVDVDGFYPHSDNSRLEVINRLILLAKDNGIVIDTKVKYMDEDNRVIETHWSVTNGPKKGNWNLEDLEFVIDYYNDSSRYK